jgi:hypothetical protein
MNYISPANHSNFCGKLQDSIKSLEDSALACNVESLGLRELKKDIELLASIFNQYTSDLNELHRLINNYKRIEKRVRIGFRQEKQLIVKELKKRQVA